MITTVPLRRRVLFWALTALFSLSASAILVELLVRIAWINPYGLMPREFGTSGYVRLHLPNQNKTFNIDGLYPGAHKAIFQTGADGQIRGKRVAGPLVYLLGGSTTECVFVSENERWPDLLTFGRVVNFGRSATTLTDTFWNLQYFLSNGFPKPERIILMEAINDVQLSWDSLVPERAIELHPERGSNSRESRTAWFERSWLVRHSSAAALVQTIWSQWQVEDSSVLKLYLKNVENVAALGPMSEEDARAFSRDQMPRLLAERAATLERLITTARANGIAVTLLTQPNSYRPDFVPPGGRDLRLRLWVQGHTVTMEQTADLLSRTNQNTVETARRLGVDLIDLAAVFADRDVSALFYDGVHFTAEGSRVVADIINAHFAAGRPVSDRSKSAYHSP